MGACADPQAEVEDFLSPMVTDTETSIEVAGLAALALGMVFVGTAEDGCVEAILQVRPYNPFHVHI